MNAARARGKDFSFIQEFKEVSTTLMCFSPKQESRLCVSKEPVCTSFNVWLGFWPLLDSEHVECFMIVRNSRVIPEFSR